MESRWIDHKGKKLFFIDLANMNYEQIQQETDELVKYIVQFPPHSLPTITDVRGTIASPDILRVFKASGTIIGKHLSRQAVVGIYGVRYVFLDVINRITGGNARPFDTIEQAKDWLADS